MRTRLSSSVTPLYRTVFPLLWILGLGVSVAMAWLAPAALPVPRWMQVLLTATWVGGGVLLLRLRRAIRHVWLEGDALVVRGRHGDRRVPLRGVVEVRELRLSNPRMVRLTVRRSDGSLVRFGYVARWEMVLPFAAHSGVRGLRERVRAARAERPRQPTPVAAGVPPAA